MSQHFTSIARGLNMGSFVESKQEFLEKGRKAQIGEVREWRGQKFQKQPNGGWLPVKQGTKGTKKEGEMNWKKATEKDMAALPVGTKISYYDNLSGTDVVTTKVKENSWEADGNTYTDEEVSQSVSHPDAENHKMEKPAAEKKEEKDAPEVGKEAEDYAGEKVTIKAVAKVSDKEALADLLSKYDKSGAMKEALDSGDADGFEYIVGTDSDQYGVAAYVWGPEGVSYAKEEKKGLSEEAKSKVEQFLDSREVMDSFDNYLANEGKEGSLELFKEWLFDKQGREMGIKHLVEETGADEEALGKVYDEKLKETYEQVERNSDKYFKKESERVAGVKDWIGDEASDQEISDVLDAVEDFVSPSMLKIQANSPLQFGEKVYDRADEIMEKYREHFDHWDGTDSMPDKQLRKILVAIMYDKRNPRA